MADFFMNEAKPTVSGLHFPAQKDELVSEAKEHNMPEHVVSFLEKIADKHYGSPGEVESELGGIKDKLGDVANKFKI